MFVAAGSPTGLRDGRHIDGLSRNCPTKGLDLVPFFGGTFGGNKVHTLPSKTRIGSSAAKAILSDVRWYSIFPWSRSIRDSGPSRDQARIEPHRPKRDLNSGTNTILLVSYLSQINCLIF